LNKIGDITAGSVFTKVLKTLVHYYRGKGINVLIDYDAGWYLAIHTSRGWHTQTSFSNIWKTQVLDES
jgi:hypothetical protein